MDNNEKEDFVFIGNAALANFGGVSAKHARVKQPFVSGGFTEVKTF